MVVFSSVLTVRNSLADMPKYYIQLNESDLLSASIFNQIQSGLRNSLRIRYRTLPAFPATGIFGWGPSANVAAVDYSTAIICSADFISQAGHKSGVVGDENVAVEDVLDKLVQLRAVSVNARDSYLHDYNQARWSKRVFTSQEYTEFMERVILILKT